MPTDKPKIIKLTWKQIDNIIENFCKNNTKKFDYIIAITRGGLVPATMISHALNIRKVFPLQVYETVSDDVNAKKKTPMLGENVNFSFIKNKKVLIVDDIIGSGATLSYVNDFLKKFNPKEMTSFCVIFNKANYHEKYLLPDIIGKTVKSWIIFPWERG